MTSINLRCISSPIPVTIQKQASNQYMTTLILISHDTVLFVKSSE